MPFRLACLVKRGAFSYNSADRILRSGRPFLHPGEMIQALKERRSIRHFKAEMPPKEVIDEIIEAGLYAPSSKGRQPTKILVVTDQKLRARLAEINRQFKPLPEGKDPFCGAPLVLVVLADKNIPTYLYDGSLTMGNLLNATHALGLGGVWIHRARQEFEAEDMKALLKELGIEGEWEGIGNCAIGYIDGEVPQPAPRKEGRVFWL